MKDSEHEKWLSGSWSTHQFSRQAFTRFLPPIPPGEERCKSSHCALDVDHSDVASLRTKHTFHNYGEGIRLEHCGLELKFMTFDPSMHPPQFM